MCPANLGLVLLRRAREVPREKARTSWGTSPERLPG